MDFVPGARLSTFLKQPTDDEYEAAILHPDLSETTLDVVYEQIADYVLQLSRLAFFRIGAVSRDDTSGTWTVTGRPLTFDKEHTSDQHRLPRGSVSHHAFGSRERPL